MYSARIPYTYYQNSRKSLELEGCEFNPYNPCVTKNIIKNNQITIFFYVDDCKLRHRIPKVVGATIEWIRQKYESILKDGSGAMSVSRGKIQKYLGMTLDYTVSEIAIISMLNYIDEILTEFNKMDPSNSGTKSSA